jgi:hypothetical protein
LKCYNIYHTDLQNGKWINRDCKYCGITFKVRSKNKLKQFCSKECNRKLKIRNLKIELLNIFGNQCACCNEHLFEFLTLEHKNLNAKEDYHSLNINHTYQMWKQAIKSRNYNKYEILCIQCNWSKRYDGICAHNRIKHTSKNIKNKCQFDECNNILSTNKYHRKYCSVRCRSLSYKRKKRSKAREVVFNAYGDFCKCCKENTVEFLTLEHINNDGQLHRAKMNQDNFKVWIDAARQNNKNKFSVLCMNCNWSKGKFGYCPHKNGAI